MTYLFSFHWPARPSGHSTQQVIMLSQIITFLCGMNDRF